MAFVLNWRKIDKIAQGASEILRERRNTIDFSKSQALGGSKGQFFKTIFEYKCGWGQHQIRHLPAKGWAGPSKELYSLTNVQISSNYKM